MNEDAEPKLAPPGAGLPKVELAIARLLFGVRRRLGSRESFTARFNRERERIIDMIRACPSEAARKKILIHRVRGLEDSSRFWSIWMTLDHLRIVHNQLARVVAALGAGKTPPGKASTAAVKPDPQVTAAVVAEFEASCDSLLSTFAGVSPLKTAARYAHPWFGPLDAFGWYTLAGVHMGIHRVQIERIKQGLGQ